MKPTNKVILYYKASADEITILGIKGRTQQVVIPKTIEGKPVVAIGAYAFAIEEELPPSDVQTFEAIITLSQTEEIRTKPLLEDTGYAISRLVLPDTLREIHSYAFSGCRALRHILLPDGLSVIGEHAFSGCEEITSLTLPKTLIKIGGYAFYNCRALATLDIPQQVEKIGRYAFYNCRGLTKINIPKNAQYLETGLFLNCDSLYEIHFGQCRHIADLISVLSQELLLTIDFSQTQAKLLIPDFQYEYIENTPARMFHQVTYGTGHLFRLCIHNSDIDFRRYDELFYLTKREDAAIFVLLLALFRLAYPYRLAENAHKAYLSYLEEHWLFATNYFIDQNDLETIRLFAQWALLNKETLPQAILSAQKRNRTEILSFLMDYQHTLSVKPKKKTFDL